MSWLLVGSRVFRLGRALAPLFKIFQLTGLLADHQHPGTSPVGVHLSGP